MAVLAIISGWGFVSCGDDDSSNPTPDPEPEIGEFSFSFNKDTVFMSQDASYSKELISEMKKGNEGEVKFISDAEWCTYVEAGNSANSFALQIAVAANESVEPRVAHVTVTFADKELKFCVKQDGIDFIQFVQKLNSYECAADGGDFVAQIQASKNYSVVANKPWIICENYISDVDGEPRTRMYVLENFSSVNREAKVSFVCGKASVDFFIKQSAGAVQNMQSWDNTDAFSVSRSLGIGWNLGNQLDAQNNGVAGEELWGNKKATQATFNALRNAGFSCVRIPVTWLGHVGNAPEYEIEDAYLSRVAEVVDYAENAGLKALINIHHDGADSKYWLNIKDAATSSATNDAIKKQITAMWTQIAKKFADKGDFLVFEAFNEIHDGGWGWGDNKNDNGAQYAVLNEWNQIFVDAVRAVGDQNATRYLGVPAYCTNIDISLESFKMPVDIEGNTNKILMAVHDYDPYTYTLENSFPMWGHTAPADKKESWGDESTITGQFKKLVDNFIAKGIPVYIGEFGCTHRSSELEENFRKYYLEYFCKAASDYNISVMYWDNGAQGYGKEHSGIINHSDGSFIDNGADIAEIMVQAYRTKSDNYSLDVVYDRAPASK